MGAFKFGPFDGDAARDAARLQRRGSVVAVLDVAQSVDLDTARAEGVDLSTLLVSVPDGITQAADIACTLVCSGAVGVVHVTGLTGDADAWEEWRGALYTAWSRKACDAARSARRGYRHAMRVEARGTTEWDAMVHAGERAARAVWRMWETCGAMDM